MESQEQENPNLAARPEQKRLRLPDGRLLAPYAKNISNQKFGRLKAINPMETDKNGKVVWMCQCECGNYAMVLSGCLSSGHTVSCGCRAYEVRRKNVSDQAEKTKIHGSSKGSPEYYTWSGMFTRCNNPRVIAYKNYGGRGIKVCDNWKDFRVFLKDMGPRPGGDIT